MNKFVHTILKYTFTVIIAITFLGVFHLSAKADVLLTYKDSVKNICNNFDGSPYAKLVSCYPNPATAYINFKFDDAVAHNSKLYIYSFTGKQMNVISITSNIIKLPLDNYYRGIYMYQLRDTNGNILESGKFQVKN